MRVVEGAAMPDSLQRGDDVGVEPVERCLAQARRHVAEADDVERNGCQQFQRRRGRDRLSQRAGLAAIARHDLAQALGAVGLDGEPHFERAEAARHLGAVFAEPRIAARERAPSGAR